MPQAGTECLICEFAVKELDSYITSNTGEFDKWLEAHVCTLLPSSDQSLCTDFVDQFGAQLVNWIAGELNPGEVCDNILDLGCQDQLLQYVACPCLPPHPTLPAFARHTSTRHAWWFAAPSRPS